MKRLLSVIILLMMVGIVGTSTVYACGGGWYSWDEAVTAYAESSETIVVGRFTKLDDVELNGIFKVESYLSGSGAEYLTVAVNDIRIIESERNAHRYFPCLVNTTRGPLSLEGQYILFLDRDIDGVYRRAWPWFDYAEMDLQTFQAELTEKIGHAPTEPNTEAPYPRTTPIILTTRSGQQYILPVDGSAPVSISEDEAMIRRRDQYDCSPAPCTAFSPNGLDVVYLLREGDEHEPPSEWAVTQEHYVVGSRISFSTTSQTFVLWHENELQLHMLWYSDYDLPEQEDSNLLHVPVEVNAISIDNSSLNYPAVWSPDGRTLAFSDNEGLWLWDVFSVDYPPQLLLPRVGNDVPVARYYSPQGRYLAVTVGDDRYNLDLVTRHELPDGYVSPDDRTLLVFDTVAEGSTTLDVAFLAPGIRQSTYYDGYSYYQVQWIDNRHFMALIGGDSFRAYEVSEPAADGSRESIPVTVEQPYSLVMLFDATGINDEQIAPLEVQYTQTESGFRQTNPVNHFVYDENRGLIQFWIGSCRLIVDSTIIDLTPYLPEPIVSAEWLPSAFYYEGEQ